MISTERHHRRRDYQHCKRQSSADCEWRREPASSRGRQSPDRLESLPATTVGRIQLGDTVATHVFNAAFDDLAVYAGTGP